MAVRTPTNTSLPVTTDMDGVSVLQWSGLLNGDTGAPVALPRHSDRSVQVTGTFGAGGTIVIEGTVDGTNYVTLTDPQGNALSKTAAFLEAVSEMTLYVRPSVTAGDGTTSLVCTMIAKR